jgi:hypothetical protein
MEAPLGEPSHAIGFAVVAGVVPLPDPATSAVVEPAAAAAEVALACPTIA